MKRTLLRQGAIVAACAAVFVFAACSDAPEFDARTDTVYSLETPSVTAKAYPGVNFVSWKPVTGANGYKVTVYEEGIVKEGSLKNSKGESVITSELTNVTFISDTNLTNGKTYTYSVEAISATNPGTTRAVYATNSRGEASVRAIVPPAGTRPLDLPAYEDGYDGKNPKEVKNKEWVVTAENLKVKAENGKVYITFPMKAYLKYEIVAYKGEDKSSHEAVNDILVDTNKASASDQNANDVFAQKSLAPSTSGKYQIAVRVTAANSLYNNDKKYDEVVYGEFITIDPLLLDLTTGDVTAKYLSDGKTARISFEPAKKDGIYVRTSWYRVYRRVKGEYAATEVTTDIKESVSGSTKTYYVDDTTIADNKQVYDYIVVVTDGTKCGKVKMTTLGVTSNLTYSASDVTAEYLYNINHFATGADNTVRITFTPAVKDGKPVPTTSYKVYRAEAKYNTTTSNYDADLKQTEVTSDTNKIMLDNADPNTYVVYDKSTDIDPAKAYIYTVVVEDDGLFKAVSSRVLTAEGKYTFGIKVGEGEEKTAYNDIEWEFTIDDTDSDVKDITVYLLVTDTKQMTPKTNEVIATGEKLSGFAKVADKDGTYTVSKKGVSNGDAFAYVVVTATCDGYEKAISNLSETKIIKHD
ncbi:MAG: hypothetical protein K2I74_01355 [Treponemataceae bacterium]|nr:hypothetical protein [Treponemataceae bacterium]